MCGGFEPTFGVDRSHASRSRGGDGLAVGVVLDVAAGEHSGDVGSARARFGDEISGEERGVRLVPDGDEHPGDGEIGLGAGDGVGESDAFDAGLADDGCDLARLG